MSKTQSNTERLIARNEGLSHASKIVGALADRVSNVGLSLVLQRISDALNTTATGTSIPDQAATRILQQLTARGLVVRIAAASPSAAPAAAPARSAAADPYAPHEARDSKGRRLGFTIRRLRPGEPSGR
jgi:hypothetical protein